MEEIQAGWNYGAGRLANISEPLAQDALLALAKQRMAQRSIREGKRNKTLNVQRPGVAGEIERAGSELANLDKRLSQTGKVRDAARPRWRILFRDEIA